MSANDPNEHLHAYDRRSLRIRKRSDEIRRRKFGEKAEQDRRQAEHAEKVQAQAAERYEYQESLKIPQPPSTASVPGRVKRSTFAERTVSMPKVCRIQGQLIRDNPELAELYKREAEPVRLPWSLGAKNFTSLGRLSARSPHIGKLAHRASELQRQRIADQATRAKAEVEAARERQQQAERLLR